MLIIYDFGMNFEMYVFISFAYADATNSSYNIYIYCIRSKMSSTSVSDRALSGLRYVNKTCRCGHRAGVRISKFDMNMNKLYYYFPHDKCRFFRWCIPIMEFETTSSTMDVSQVLRKVHQLRVDIVSLQKTVESFKRLITLGIGLVLCFALMYWA